MISSSIALLGALASPARASSFGIGAAVIKDLPDFASDAQVPARFNAGGALLFPVRFDLAPAAALRGTLRFDASTKGTDYITWRTATGDRIGEEPVWAAFVSTAATVGPEVRFSVDGAVRPYVAGEAGLAL